MEEKPAIFSLFSSSLRAEPPVGEQPDASLCNSGVPAMDEGEGAPLDDCRFDHEEEHQQSSPDPGKKKRKFQQEYLILPLSKHKFRDRPCSPSISSHGSSSAVTQLESDETSEGSMASDRRQLSWGSPSINNSRGSSENPIPCSPSWASSSLQSNRYSQCGSVLNDAAVAINSTGSPSDDGILTEAGEEALETYDDYVGDLPQASTEELTTCSTDLTSDISLYFSPKWAVRLGSRNPTIDEEFERYFSALML